MPDPSNALVLTFAFFVAVCIVSLLAGRLARPPRPTEFKRTSSHVRLLPCAQPMSARARIVYMAAIVILLLIAIGVNFQPYGTTVPLACQSNAGAGS